MVVKLQQKLTFHAEVTFFSKKKLLLIIVFDNVKKGKSTLFRGANFQYQLQLLSPEDEMQCNRAVDAANDRLFYYYRYGILNSNFIERFFCNECVGGVEPRLYQKVD